MAKPTRLNSDIELLVISFRYLFGFLASITVGFAIYFSFVAWFELSERGFEPFWASGDSLEVSFCSVTGLVLALSYLFLAKVTFAKSQTYPKVLCILVSFVFLAYEPLVHIGAFSTDCTAFDNCNGGAVLRDMSSSKHNYLKGSMFEDMTPRQYRYTLEDPPASKAKNGS